MNKHWKTWSMVSALALITTPAFAQKDKENAPKEIVVQVTAKESESNDDDSQEGKKKVNVTVVEAGGGNKDEVVAKLIKELKGTSMGEEQKTKVLESVRKALEGKFDAEGGKKVLRLELNSNKVNSAKSGEEGKVESKSDVQVEVNSEVIVLDKDGKQQRLQLRQARPQLARVLGAPAQGGTIRVQGGINDDIKQKVKEQLKANGLEEKVIASVMDSLNKAGGPIKVEGHPLKIVEGHPLQLAEGHLLPTLDVQGKESKPRFILGIALEPEEEGDDKDADEGLNVLSVFEDSPAAKAGVKVDDVVRKIDGKGVKSVADLIAKVQEAGNANKAVKILIDREGKEKELEITPKKEVASFTFSTEGLPMLPEDLKRSLEGISGQAKGFVLPPNAKGVQGFLFRQQAEGNDEALEELKEEIEELKEELKELKTMIKALKSNK